MFSWFPIFFPLRRPLHLPAGAPVDAHLWRCAAHTKARACALGVPVSPP